MAQRRPGRFQQGCSTWPPWLKAGAPVPEFGEPVRSTQCLDCQSRLPINSLAQSAAWLDLPQQAASTIRHRRTACYGVSSSECYRPPTAREKNICATP